MQLSLKTRTLEWLTPDLLSEFKSTARIKGDCIIEVKDENDMFLGIAASMYHKGDMDFKGSTVNCNTISLSQVIDVERFQSAFTPELNFKKISRDQIYRFVVYHEIGHALYDPKIKNMWASSGVDEDKTWLLKLAKELRADRYAWKSLFPSQPLPQRPGCDAMVASVESFIIDHKDLFPEPRDPKLLPG
jgi:hypothetical protein